jgi:pyruvate/2-oxoglutarate dehydrogenase complex dihydrolipoamide dehydrogenase (E3) component
MMARKEEVISQTCDGVQYLMDKNKIKVFMEWVHLSIKIPLL